MRILIVHNLLWAHYKSTVFQALQQLVDQQQNTEVRVLQIARNERSRAGLEAFTDASAPTYAYEHELLFDRFVEEVGLYERVKALLQRSRAYRPDVIHLTGYYDPAQLTLLLWAKANGIRVVMQNESTASDHQRGGWKEQFKRWFFRQCDGFFCFGSQSADYLLQLGVPPAKILLRKNAVDNNALRSVYEKTLPNRESIRQAMELRAKNFIFVGRLIQAKNLPVLLDAFSQALQRTVNPSVWGLILLGDGTEHEPLVEQISALTLSNEVTILPGRPWFRVPEVLALSDVLVLPSRSEPWGLVVNEAMACGLPVIVSDHCGCVKDLVHHEKNGFVFDPDQPAQLTQYLLRFMDGTVNVRQMRQFARESIEPYAPEVVAKEMLDGFRKIMN
ncbi:glycosyltransferase family 4 protein [Spirosoma sp.]|uniref:glycosyltransferase family 4 protein n=1 Tax=Spirosoma sp. TaxID=1899569 RepID=UPI00263535DF|nr:glycosyltransferase family 4 protein [Spirosoma sp.]MCX6215720.1 glycosyltransferase family 4 protein [Spirosoma sp.]